MRLLTRRGAPYEYHEEESKTDLFSVTQVRKVLCDPYVGIPADVLEQARLRGTVLHRRWFFALAHVSGAYAEYPARIEEYGGYCDSQDRWIEQVRPRAIRLEEKGWHPDRGYAGQVDMQVILERHRYGDLALGDLKSGTVNPTDVIQVSAYNEMLGFKSKHLLLLYLDADGGMPREVWVERERHGHVAAFLNALSLLRWRMTYTK